MFSSKVAIFPKSYSETFDCLHGIWKSKVSSTLQPLIKSINWLQPAMYLFELFFLPNSLILCNNVYRKLGECWVCFSFAFTMGWNNLWIQILSFYAPLLSQNIYVEFEMTQFINSLKWAAYKQVITVLLKIKTINLLKT